MSFTSFSCPVSLARTFSVVLSKSGKIRHLCLVSDLGEKAFRFSLLSIALAVDFFYVVFIVLR